VWLPFAHQIGKSHGADDVFWLQNDILSDPSRYKDMPVYLVGGWYDSWAAQVANLNYVQLSKAKKSLQRLIVGPWTHSGQEQSFSGIAEFGNAAALDLNGFRLRWFDRWLMGASKPEYDVAPSEVPVKPNAAPKPKPSGN